jgi:hypothetical protein
MKRYLIAQKSFYSIFFSAETDNTGFVGCSFFAIIE